MDLHEIRNGSDLNNRISSDFKDRDKVLLFYIGY